MARGAEQHLQEQVCFYLHTKNVLYCASAGGMRTSISTAIRMKRAGYKKGFPDIGIFEPRGRCHGMFVELKVGSRATPEQIEWRDKLLANGYHAIIAPSNLDFVAVRQWVISAIDLYLGLEVSYECPTV